MTRIQTQVVDPSAAITKSATGYVNIQSTTAASRTLDIHNYAAQGSAASDKMGVVIHHYADDDGVWIDNVGSGAGLVLNLSNNPTNRPDKAASYVGDGPWLTMRQMDLALPGYRTKLRFDVSGTGASAEARMIWTEGRGHLVVNKADDAGWAYVLETTNEHANVLTLGGVLQILSDVSKSRTQIASDSSQTNGLFLNAAAGNVTIDAAGGTVQINKQIKLNYAGATGSGSAALGANSPATTNTAPFTWLKFTSSDGSLVYVPAWK